MNFVKYSQCQSHITDVRKQVSAIRVLFIFVGRFCRNLVQKCLHAISLSSCEFCKIKPALKRFIAQKVCTACSGTMNKIFPYPTSMNIYAMTQMKLKSIYRVSQEERT
jgi:hypothetical protein